ncbi:Exosome complex component RRP40 [Pseudozyma hubeiensis]|nr:Exosome complex component RRP40 [Pseudozyma hubeiensis]
MTVVLPGDIVPIASSSSIKLGPGLLPTPSSSSSTSLTAIRTGPLGTIPSSSNTSSSAYYIESSTQRYIPSPSDSVIAQITSRNPESYTATLFSAHTATLPALSFEGATKRHKPNLKIGTLVYARVVSADRFTEPELTCVNPVTGKSDGFGELKVTDERGERVGFAGLIRCSIGLSRSLLRPSHTLLKQVATHFPFEAAVGANGTIWIRANTAKHVIAVTKVVEAADLHATTHGSGEEDEGLEDESVVDAEYVVKHRAAGLDAKAIRALVQEYL